MAGKGTGGCREASSVPGRNGMSRTHMALGLSPCEVLRVSSRQPSKHDPCEYNAQLGQTEADYDHHRWLLCPLRPVNFIYAVTSHCVERSVEQLHECRLVPIDSTRVGVRVNVQRIPIQPFGTGLLVPAAQVTNMVLE